MWLRAAIVGFAIVIMVLAGHPPAGAEVPPTTLIPTCTDLSFRGASGQINIRTSPNRFVAWNIAMYSPWRNDGPWIVDIFVNNRRVDHKAQDYQPHGSISSRDLPTNSFVSIGAWHVDLAGTEHIYVPNQCLVP